MLELLESLPPDPILGLSTKFHHDANPDKVNLGVGVYQDEQGNTPIFESIKQAERLLLDKQTTKSYMSQKGDREYQEGITELMLGKELTTSLADRIGTVMTPGGSGALRMIGGMIAATPNPRTVWVSTPTWGNHFPLLESAGLKLEGYPYHDSEKGTVDFAAMMAALDKISEGDIVLLHGCCHNPTGADLSMEEWQQVVDLLNRKKGIPFIDLAYQGLANSLDEDAYGIRLAAEKLPEVLVANSSSKNFGVYRERAGLALIIGETKETTEAGLSHVLSIARRTYSMSAYHGAAVVGQVLDNPEIKNLWESELAAARDRINGLRKTFADHLNAAQDKKDFSFVNQNKGMFSLLGLSKEQAERLRNEFGVYMLNSSRVNVAGLSTQNMDTVVKAIVDVL